MSCVDNYCGTGLGTPIPQPGDPSNNVELSASAQYGGISVSWSYPTNNPQAVAHTYLYRGTNNVFENAMEIAVVAGSIYFDRFYSNQPTTYYYWIKIVSTSGNINDAVGPATAITRSYVDETIESLTGRIDSGVLAQALKAEIGNITMVNGKMNQEILDRIAANAALAAGLKQVEDGSLASLAFISQEIIKRQDADSAQVSMINTLAAATDDVRALIFEESTVRATKDNAFASQITNIFVSVEANAAAIREEATASVSRDNANATKILQVESTLNGNVASFKQEVITNISTINGKVVAIGALYTARLSVNGLIGGFGIYNDGTTVEAGFDVDTFFVGRTNANKVRPFIISNGVVYIDKVRIRDADIDTLKIAGNAVTTSQSARGGASCTINLQASGQPVTLIACGTGNYTSQGTLGGIRVEIRRNGLTIAAATATGNPGGDDTTTGSISLSATPVVVDYPPPGFHSYSFVVLGGTGGGTDNINAILLETKR